MQNTTILIVDDDKALRDSLRPALEAEGWKVFEAWNRSSLFEAISKSDIDLVALDVCLGKEDGHALARDLRAVRNIPILMISSGTEPFDRVRGLECGADDHVDKPVDIKNLLVKIRKLLEMYRAPISGNRTLTFDHSAFDLQRRVVKHLDGTPVELTNIELRLLELFVRNPGRVLSRDDISRALRGREWSPFDRTIDGHVARLRRKIKHPGDAPLLIRTVRNVGYVFTGNVEFTGEDA